MPADPNTLLTRLLAAFPTVIDEARDVVDAAQRVGPAVVDELRQARGETADHIADIGDAFGPLLEALDGLSRAVWPEAEAHPDVTPVTDVRDAPAVLAGDLDPGVVDGRTDAPTDDEGSTGPDPQ